MAMRACRARTHHRQFTRHAVDAHVQKAAEQQSKEEKYRNVKNFQRPAPLTDFGGSKIIRRSGRIRLVTEGH
jgi:hypothetical protein